MPHLCSHVNKSTGGNQTKTLRYRNYHAEGNHMHSNNRPPTQKNRTWEYRSIPAGYEVCIRYGCLSHKDRDSANSVLENVVKIARIEM
mmetsp:Transcript_2807/g.2819  ORF Transcript_2807/g.2819 Transcript_2807/m.2819 type:complete len:88 (+) Transcript_2807:3-266(+)